MREAPIVRQLRRRLRPWWRRPPIVALAYVLTVTTTAAIIDVAALAFANWWTSRR